MKKTRSIFFNALPILVMVGLIPLISNDYVLSTVYIFIIGLYFLLNYNKKEGTVFLFGLLFMIVSEYVFISTGVETFTRNSLLGVMPLWLPLIWGCGFVAIKRSVEIL